MANFEQKIAERVQAFVVDITELARRRALETLSEALDAGVGRSGLRRRNGVAPVRGGGARGRGRGNRRSPEEIASMRADLLGVIRSQPGLRVEQIAQQMKARTKELTLPIRKLIADNRVRTEGQRRATRYYPSGGKATAGRGKKRRGRSAATAAAAAE